MAGDPLGETPEKGYLGVFTFKIGISTQIRRGRGVNLPHNISIAYYSRTESRIDVKPDRKFKFVYR